MAHHETKFQQQRRGASDALMACAPNALLGLDPGSRRVLHVSSSLETLCGLSPQASVGRTLEEAGLPDAASAAIDHAVGAALATGDSAITSFALPPTEANGAPRHFEASVTLIRGGQDAAQLIIVLRDVSRQRQLIDRYEEVLAEEYRRLESTRSTLRARERFLALLSHEMRSPLHAMQNWTHLLDSGMADTSSLRKRAFEGLRKGIEAQVRTLDRLLDPVDDDSDVPTHDIHTEARVDLPILLQDDGDDRRARGA